MNERPIIFSGPMIRAILDSRKTQTRRVVKRVPHWQHCGRDIMDWGLSGCYTDDKGRHWLDIQTAVDDNSNEEIQCPYGQPGDRLWCRETWGLCCYHDPTDWCDGSIRGIPESELRERFTVEHRQNWITHPDSAHWRPSIFMPRWASRITLEITGVRVERLQEISIPDSHAEGVGGTYGETGINVGFPGENHEWDNKNAIEQYAWLWESINGQGSWDANPWVWAIEFRRVK